MNKLSESKIRESFNNENYIITENWIYINYTTHIPFICPNNHEHKITWDKWLRGQRCGLCSRYSTNYKLVKEAFNKEGYLIKENNWEYKNRKTHIPFICPNNHEHKITWCKWIEGQRCVWCGNAKRNSSRFGNDNLNLYFIRIYDWINNKSTYKWGISIYNPNIRFEKDIINWGFKIEVIKQTIDNGKKICMMEQSLLYEVKDNKTEWVPKEFGGYSECFDLTLKDALFIWNKVVNSL